MFETNEKKKYIILKNGYNKPLIIGVLITLLLSAALFMFMLNQPDTRAKKTVNNDTSMMMSYITIDVPKKMQYDENNNIGQIELYVTKTNKDKQYNASYEVYDDTGTKQQVNIVKSDNLYEDKESVIDERKVLLQFTVPKEFYFMYIKIEQKENTYKEIMFDYRDVKKANLKERGKNYIKELMKEETKLTDLTEKKEELEKNVSDFKKELKEYEKLSDEELLSKQSEMTEKTQKMNVVEDELKEIKKEIEIQNKLITSLKD